MIKNLTSYESTVCFCLDVVVVVFVSVVVVVSLMWVQFFSI